MFCDAGNIPVVEYEAMWPEVNEREYRVELLVDYTWGIGVVAGALHNITGLGENWTIL